MPELDQIYRQIDELDPAEREELIVALSDKFRPVGQQSPVQDFPSIVATPGVCGGAPRLIRTRIPVWTVERMRQLGVSEADVLRSYPNLHAADLVQVRSYAELHRDEIDGAIRENEAA